MVGCLSWPGSVSDEGAGSVESADRVGKVGKVGKVDRAGAVEAETMTRTGKAEVVTGPLVYPRLPEGGLMRRELDRLEDPTP